MRYGFTMIGFWIMVLLLGAVSSPPAFGAGEFMGLPMDIPVKDNILVTDFVMLDDTTAWLSVDGGVFDVYTAQVDEDGLPLGFFAANVGDGDGRVREYCEKYTSSIDLELGEQGLFLSGDIGEILGFVGEFDADIQDFATLFEGSDGKVTLKTWVPATGGQVGYLLFEDFLGKLDCTVMWRTVY